MNEDWSLILDVCDRVAASPSGPSQAVSALIKRLAHRNANVQLYALELANALSQNCGPELHRELASKAFTDALLRLAADRNTHGQVKQKVLERMGSWSEMFKGSHELGIMDQAYHRLRQTQPGLMPPSKPSKSAISSEDRRKEDEELQMALALSVQDSNKATSGPAQANGTVGDDSESQPPQAGTSAAGTTAATVSRVRALYDFTPSEPGELAFKKNDIIAVLESVYKDWWKGSLRGQTGIFPLNYVEKLQDATKEELERDAHMEAEVFGEVRSVEKLLALLSVEGGSGRRGEREEDEIAELYQRTLSIRPKLVELIGKYSQKKDDFTQLNEKFIKARRDYEALLEASMSQPQQYQQQYPMRHHQSSYPPPQQQQQQPPYGGQMPPSGYPPQGPPSGGYQPYTAPNMPPQQQDPQRYFSPAPPNEQHPQPGFGNSYAPAGGPPNGPAPFHFIPGGVQDQQQPPQPATVGRKPTPQQAAADAYSAPSAPPPQAANPGGFQGQIRPGSIHTLNSGNPQELAGGGYESPIDNRHSTVIPTAMGGYDPYSQQPPPQQRQDLPSQMQHMSLESPSSMYSPQHSGGAEGSAPPFQQQQQQQAPPHGGYQAYQPYQPPQPQPQGQQGMAGGDPGDFYR